MPLSFMLVMAVFLGGAKTHAGDFDPKADLSHFVSDKPLAALREHGLFTLGDLKLRYAAGGLHWFRGLGYLRPKGVQEVQAMEAFAFVRAGTRMDPSLRPLDLLPISANTQYAMHLARLWNLREIRVRYRTIGREGFQRFDKMGGKGLDEIDALMACADDVEAL